MKSFSRFRCAWKWKLKHQSLSNFNFELWDEFAQIFKNVKSFYKWRYILKVINFISEKNWNLKIIPQFLSSLVNAIYNIICCHDWMFASLHLNFLCTTVLIGTQLITDLIVKLIKLVVKFLMFSKHSVLLTSFKGADNELKELPEKTDAWV